MTLRLLPFLLAFVVMGQGCIIQHDVAQPPDPLEPGDVGPGTGSANITFAWTFDGQSCAQAGVQSVVITMPGELLQNDGRFPCTSGAQDGITLDNFLPGTYPYTVEAYDARGQLRYQGNGEVQIQGADWVEYVSAVSITIDGGVHGVPPGGTTDGWDGGLDAGSGPPADEGGPDGGLDAGVDAGVDGGTGGGQDGGSATYRYYLSWTFQDVPNAPVCGGELTQVVLTIDGTSTTYGCTDGLSPAQITTPPLTLGTHVLRFDAESADGTVWASKQSSLDVTCGCHPSQTYELPWVVGSAAVDWIFFDSAHQNPTTSCDVAQVDTLAVNFQGGDGSWLFSDEAGVRSDDSVGCADSGGRVIYRALPPGSYSVFLAGNSSCGTYSEYPGQACYQATVEAGVFLTRDAYLDRVVSIDLDQH